MHILSKSLQTYLKSKEFFSNKRKKKILPTQRGHTYRTVPSMSRHGDVGGFRSVHLI